MMRGVGAALASGAAAAVWCIGCGPGAGDVPPEADPTYAGGGVVTLWTDALELFVEYPPHVRDEAGDAWAIHLTWLADWTPVREGSLTLGLHGPGGAREEIVMAAPNRPGVFTAMPVLPAAGTWLADLTLSARGRDYQIPVGELQVFESVNALSPDEETSPAGLITLLKEQQWTMPFAVAVADERSIPRSIRAAGEIVAPADGFAHVSAPVAGLVLVQGPSPAPGDPVAEGQTLALIAPTSLDDSFARMQVRVGHAEREAARAERLYAAEAIPERRLLEARREVEVARAAFEAVGGVQPPEGDETAHLYSLRSPIGGVISDRHVAPGQHVEAGAHAFTVINPATLWFIARLPAREAGAAGDVDEAWFTVEGAADTYATDRLVSVGSVIDPDTRTLPMRFAVSNPERKLKVGMLAEGRLLTGEPVTGVAVPSAAIQDEDGLAVVYVEIGGESFQRRVVEPGPSEGSWTLVSGVASGERVVTLGGYQVFLASLGNAELTDHGHPH
jgi:RND family efflux transporter MFP subunit